MMRNERGQALVADLPIERLLTETDGPLPELHGRPSHPIDVPLAVDAIARTRGKPAEVVARSVRANLETLLRS